MSDLKPCPFCGGKASIERIGTSRVSCVISCEDCGATLESNEQHHNFGENWNTRAKPRDNAIVPRKPSAETLWEINERKPQTVREVIEMFIELEGK